MAWYHDNSRGVTHLVGTKQANALGLFDMHGNARKWAADGYRAYSAKPVTDPVGQCSTLVRVNRGGGLKAAAQNRRVAFRIYRSPDSRSDFFLGFAS
jgi:formylglycine-generating enzyme required for sulfatase activity